jgi:hypothetical protein
VGTGGGEGDIEGGELVRVRYGGDWLGQVRTGGMRLRTEEAYEL